MIWGGPTKSEEGASPGNGESQVAPVGSSLTVTSAADLRSAPPFCKLALVLLVLHS